MSRAERHPAGPAADALLTPKQPAALRSWGEGQLRRWRTAGTGPLYFRITARVIRYSARSVTTYSHRG